MVGVSVDLKDKIGAVANRSMMVMIGQINAAELRALAASIDSLSPKRSVFHVCFADVAVDKKDFAPDFDGGTTTEVSGARDSE